MFKFFFNFGPLHLKMMKRLDLKNSSKRIDTPLAKYNSAGQLFCVLCNTLVKSEIFWTGHVNGRSHQDALHILKSKKRTQVSIGVTQNEDEGPSAPKKIALSLISTKSNLEEIGKDNTFKVPLPVSTNTVLALGTTTPTGKSQLLSSTEETKIKIVGQHIGEDEDDKDKKELCHGKEDPEKHVNGINLPEGFFDDPKEDAKIRGKEWRDPEEVEWERFIKEIANEELKSSNLRSQDEEDSTKTRELEEIEEQMAHWQKVIDLERKADETKKQNKLRHEPSMIIDDDEDIDEYEEEMDWRSKRH